MAITIYGIKNCDTMKKARAWLDKHGVEYAFHDYKTAGIDRDRLERWARRPAGRRCSTAPARRSASCPTRTRPALDEKKAIALMLEQPSMIKRPVLDLGGGKLLVGFKPEIYERSAWRVAEARRIRDDRADVGGVPIVSMAASGASPLHCRRFRRVALHRGHADRFVHGPAVRPVHQARAGRAVRRCSGSGTAPRRGSAGGARRCCSAASPRCSTCWRGAESYHQRRHRQCRADRLVGLLLAGRARLRPRAARCWIPVLCWRRRSGSRVCLVPGFLRQPADPHRAVVRPDRAAAGDVGGRVLARPRRAAAVALAGDRDLRLVRAVLRRRGSR